MKIEKRKDPLRVVRSENKVPGVLYGKSINPVSISIEEGDLHSLLKEYGYTKTFKVTLGRTSHQVYIKDIQFDAIKRTHALNVKLQKVKEGDTIKANVPLNIIGKEAIEKPGIIVQVISDSVDVEYPVGKGLAHIDLDISTLGVGQAIHVKDLELPDYLIVHDEEEKVLVNVTEVSYQEEAEDNEVVEDEITETAEQLPE